MPPTTFPTSAAPATATTPQSPTEPAAPPTDLAGIQRWLQRAIVQPTDAPDVGWRADEPRAEQVIRPSKTLSPQARIDIYASMYLARLVEVLGVDYPAVRHLLGDQFPELIRQYLAQYPSVSWNLNATGRYLPRFLRTPRTGAAIDWPNRPQLADLARLERAISDVFDSEPDVPLATADLSKVPPNAWPTARVKPIRAFRLLALDWTVNPVVTAVKHEAPLPPIIRQKNWLVVYRGPDLTLWRMTLTNEAHAILSALEQGKTVEQSLMAAMRVTTRPVEALEHDVFRWFRTWVAEGLFDDVLWDSTADSDEAGDADSQADAASEASS